jgi:PAS domain S-box-containing protein
MTEAQPSNCEHQTSVNSEEEIFVLVVRTKSPTHKPSLPTLTEPLPELLPALDETETMPERELRILVDSANTPIFGIDVDGKVNEWNFKTAEITGYSREEAFHKPFCETFIVPKLRDSVKEVFNKALQGTETSNYELYFETKSKEERYLLVNASTRWDIHNNIVGGEFSTATVGYQSFFNLSLLY